MGDTIKKQLFSGVFYTALAKYSGILISLVVTAILARLISAQEFGVVAIATVIITFFNIFTDMGIAPAIIQNKTLTDEDVSHIFSFTIWSGIVIAFLFFCASWPISNYYNSPILRTLCQLLSINLFFASANIVPDALFYKHKEFKFIAMRSFFIQLSCGALAVSAALSGAGVFALLITPIFSCIAIFIVSIKRYPQKLYRSFGISVIKKIFSYSAYQFLFNIINYFSRNLDTLMIGKYMSMTLLGYYDKSYRLMMLPLQNITQVVTPVMHPILSDYQNDYKQLSSSYERIVRFLAFIGFPLAVLLFFTASEDVLIIFGNKWMPSIPIFRILSLSVGIQIVLSSSGSIFQASGDTRSLFVCGLFSSILNVTGILLGIFWWGTLEAVAFCILTTFTINFLQCYIQMYLVTFHRSIWNLFKQLISPIICSAIIAICLLPLSQSINNMNIFFTFSVKCIVSFTIFGCYLQITHEYDLIGKVKKLIHKITKHEK